MQACSPCKLSIPMPHLHDPTCTKGDLYFAQNLHKQNTINGNDIQQIIAEGQKIRRHLREVVSPWRYETKPCVVAVQGFCNTQLRNNLLRGLINFFHPYLIHAAQVGKDRWESIMLLHLREGCIRRHFNSNTSSLCALDFTDFVQTMQNWLDRFCVQANAIELAHWCDMPTLTSVDRINAGSHRFGNWHHEKCLRYVYEYLFKRSEIYKSQQNAYMREQTGLEFSVGNMMQVAFERQNLELEISTLRSLHTQTVSHLSTLQTLCNVHSAVLQELRLATIQRMHTQRAPVLWPEGTAVDSRLVAAIESHQTTTQTIENLRNILNPPTAPVVIDLTSQDTNFAHTSQATAHTSQSSN